ncbi:ATP-binding cassette subfamily B protein [Aeromicrobium panaciterrae]|uniref:ATP-binding cassette subfamily B protein n=1 Tax=Aeromicrobium panaciterrae TaxID=363861 RepID=A0ABU1UQL2_9ACTN|nr:ABC transporter ATP-binding protein [Aeromicrobium panaciterrae]MDR7087440.1 ATP-binding cassette subfamily B protein [Aeromicrobium panaciterrae]
MLIPLMRTYLAPYKGPLAVVIFFQLAGTIANLYLPGLNADIIDKGIVQGDTGFIVSTGTVMLGFTVLQVICTIIAVYYGARTSMAVGRDMRAGIFGKVETFAQREMTELGAPTLITRTTNDVQQVQLLVFMLLTMLVAAPIMGVGGLVMALRQDVELSGILVFVLPVLIFCLSLIIRRLRPLFRQLQERIDDINGVMREQIMGIRVIRAFVKEDYETERFRDANHANMDVAISVGKLTALFFPLVMLIMNVSVVLATWIGGFRVGSGDLDVGTLTAFQAYITQILMSVMMATFLFMMWPRAEVSAERITEVLETEPSVLAPDDAVEVTLGEGRIDIEKASFAFPGAEQDVLHEIDLIARPGETTAIIGSTGSGKTTLLSLIPRLFDATAGTIRIDGHDIRSLHPENVWAAIGLVPQRPFLFGGTVASNLKYGRPDATDEELWDALEIAQAKDFVMKMPEQLNAPISQGGTNVSGGQRQRLAIARAIVKRPPIYLFDDSFSALDYATDAALRNALRAVTADAAVVIVAQRVSTIRNADRIVVLDEGRVVGTGKHPDLMQTCEVYREIVLSQLTEEEAA